MTTITLKTSDADALASFMTAALANFAPSPGGLEGKALAAKIDPADIPAEVLSAYVALFPA